jgi:histidinol dehydrogenase
VLSIRIISSSDGRRLATLLDRRGGSDAPVERRVRRIVDDVRRRGDVALRGYARRFDGLDGEIEVTQGDMTRLAATVPAALRAAIGEAARRIRKVAGRQVPKGWTAETAPGVRIEQRVTPLDRVGCYVPGGRYPLPSSLLMTAIPARAAGVSEVIAVCPRPDATVCAAALAAGVDRLFRIGGAHAIAALAYGTRTVPRVDKIVGPGNAYVAAAKAQVAADCAIDFFAGPSEIAIVSASGNPAWIAADLIAQAEHDPEARAILLTPGAALARAVAREVACQMPAAGPASAAIRRHGGIIVTRTMDEAVDLCQRMAPEHVVCDTDDVAARLTRAGTVFVGGCSAQAAGDYATGSNHVLPTSGAARARGGLSAADFVRVQSVQRLTERGLRRIGGAVVTLAEAEGLAAHAASIRMRIESDVPRRPMKGQPAKRPGRLIRGRPARK